MSPFVLFWALLLSLGWLLPNHYPPWLAFYADAWVGFTIMLAAVVVLAKSTRRLPVHGIAVLTLALLLLLWVQFLAGLVVQVGIAWLFTIYLLGFLLSVLIGQKWEVMATEQMLDGLFLAIGIAAVISVGLQLRQCFGLEGMEVFVIGDISNRPSANFGQPNQLATLLLWGIVASLWAFVKGRVGPLVTSLLLAYLLLGLALTGSRASQLGVLLMVAAICSLRSVWRSKNVVFFACIFTGYFWTCLYIVNKYVGTPNEVTRNIFGMIGQLADYGGVEIRLRVWQALLDAALQKPWFGYGWGQNTVAQFAVALDHSHLNGMYPFSHNLFLDLVLWCGIPLGIAASIFLLHWLWNAIRSVQSSENVLLCIFLLVVFNHAMFEMPLYYGYFLFPMGLVMGCITARSDLRPIICIGKWVVNIVLIITAALSAFVVQDYLRVEASYRILRLEWIHINITIPVGPPDVVLLTQWRDYIAYARLKPESGMRTETLNRLRTVVELSPNLVLLNKLATALALNNRQEEAVLWLRKACRVVPAEQCAEFRRVWQWQSDRNPTIASVPWPKMPEERKNE